MIDGKKVYAVIPARGGSKGLPMKNIMDFCGKPLIAWSIDAAMKSRYIDYFIVSTDDPEIQKTAQKYCANVSIRPDYLAEDTTPTFDVLNYVIKNQLPEVGNGDYLVLLEPTSPLRTSIDIDTALSLLVENKKIADSIVGVTKVEAQHPAFNYKVNNKGLLEPYDNESFKTLRRQDLDELFYLEGTIYISKVIELLSNRGFYHSKTMPYKVPRWKAVEIDDKMDLLIAETIFNNRKFFETET